MPIEFECDPSMLEIFRAEVETHSESLTAGLLTLEHAPAHSATVEEMMRAAHSIKGAARIVGLDRAVQVAHVMEDCFVAARSGRIQLGSQHVDVLLQGVDILARIAARSSDRNAEGADDDQGMVDQLVIKIQQILTGLDGGPPTGGQSAGGPRADQAETRTASHAKIDLADAVEPVPVTITAPQRLDDSAAEELRRQLVRAIQQRSEIIRVDLSAVVEMSVSGLALLAAAPTHVAASPGIHLELAAVSPQVDSILQITGVAQYYPSYSSVRSQPTS